MKSIDIERTLQMHLEEDEKLIKINIITFNSFWNILIAVQTYSTTIVMTYILAYNHIPPSLLLVMFLGDLFYLADFVGGLIYVKNWKTRRFLPYKPKDWRFFVVDFVSLIPFAYTYETYVANETKSDLIFRILLQNRCLRIYRIFLLFSFYDLTIRNAYQYLILMAFKFIALSVLVSHTMACIWFNLPNVLPCEGGHYQCIIWREVSVFRVFTHQWSGEKIAFDSPPEMLLVIIVISFGLCFIYGDLIPHLLLIFLRISRTKGRFYQKYLKLEQFLRNIGVDKPLNEKIEKYFNHFWLSGTTGQEMEKLMADLPLALKKEVFTDIYWDAFRHSDLFRDVSRSCKRSMSLHMTTEYCQEGDVIWGKGGFKNKMIYLVEGVMELMAAENENSPIMSFSSGTVLGEMSLFLILKNHATIRCRTLCEIHTLTLRDTCRVLLSYPKDRNIVFQKLNKRLVIAKITQWRKRRITLEKMLEFDFAEGQTISKEENEDRVKWVKMQWRAIWEVHERYVLVQRAEEGGLRIPAWRKQYEIQTRLDTVSNFMDLMVLSNIFEEKKDVVCLKTVFPWAIDPMAEFLRVWRVIVIIAAIISSVVYPYCCGWLESIPKTVFTTSIVCSLIFEIDLALLLMTAVKTKHGIFTDFTTILMNCVKKPTFYMDIMAAMPIQLYKHFNVSSTWLGYLLLPCVLKAHVFLKPGTTIRESMVFTCIVKNVFFLLLLTYWFAAIIQLTSNRCFPFCGFFKWDVTITQHLDDFTRENLASVFLAMSTALHLTDHSTTRNVYYVLTLTASSVFFFFWLCYFLGDFYTVYSIKISNQMRFMILYDRIMQYLESVQIPSQVQKRIVRIVRFQWSYNKGDDLLTKTPAVDLAPKSLRREIYANSIYPTLRSCPLFQYESPEFIYDNIERCEIIAVPSGTALVNYGIRCNRIHLLYKGYCQTTSFLTKDVTGGLGAPVLIKPGDIFPPLAAFASVPAPISVMSLTDCVIIVFQLENILKTMISYDIFRDFIVVLRSSNLVEKLSRHTFGMMPVNVQFNAPIDKKEEYEAPFRGLGRFGGCLKRILLHRDMFFDENQQQKLFYEIISITYICYLAMMAFIWPLCFGLLMYQARYIFPVLFSFKLFVFFYIYLQFHVPYFDERGLLIKHPLYTMRHYLTTNFILDILMNVPFYVIYRQTYSIPGEMDNRSIVLLTIIQKLLGLLPINGYFSTINKQSGTTLLNRNIYTVLFLAAILNAAANYDMFMNVIWTFDENGEVVGFTPRNHIGISDCRSREKDKVVDFYVTITFWLFGQLTSNNCFCETYFWEERVFALLISFIGTILIWIVFGWLASHSVVSDAIATVYQERMKSFLEFLVSSKTDDRIVERAIGYFEHQWSRSRGQNLREICERLPHHLHEELAYPLYRPTLHKVAFFSNADESFFAMLSTNLDLVHFNRGSIILTRGQVQSDIFFVHSGKCFVFDWFLTLDLGSMIGDLNHTGRTVNKVFALTHVELLRINSHKFFSILNNYYYVESRFLGTTMTSENFIKSQYVQQSNQIRPVDSRDVLNAFDLQSKDLGFEDQSYFEDPENITTQKSLAGKQTSRRRKHYTFTIYPGTFAMFVYNVINFTVAFLTMITTPSFLFYGGLTWPAFLVTAILDGLWSLCVLATFRVGIEDKLKGDVVTDGRFIAKTYVLSLDGFFLRLIACLPFELIPILTSNSLQEVDHKLVAGLRSLRLIRVYFLVKSLIDEVNKLKVSSVVRYISVVIFYILDIHFMVLVYYIVASKDVIVQSMTPHEFGEEQVASIFLVYHFVMNIATSTNLSYLVPDSLPEMLYFNICSVLSIYANALIIKSILSIKYVHNLARGKHKSQVGLLESYLKRHDLSPSILKEVLDYKQNLLIVARSENNPTFLQTAPASLRIAIMSDLYLVRLRNSPVFSGVSSFFLKLLVCRLKRQIFFPGQKIVEKGDVDNTMYFIHQGEVYVVDQTNDEAYIEFVIDRMFPGDEFGQAQGLSLAKPHSYTYRARTIVEILSLSSADWIDLKQFFPEIYSELIETSKKFL